MGDEVTITDPVVVKLSDRQFKQLDLRFNAINGAINRLSDNLGKWLALIAEGTGEADQAKIDALTAEIKQEREAVQTAIDTQKG